MTEEELREQWGKESAGLPLAFTIAELQDRGVERVAGETRSHLERLLLQRRNEELFRSVGLGVLALVCVVTASMQPAAWTLTLLILVALVGALLVLATRQLLALHATTRALRETVVPGVAPSPGQSSFAHAVAVLMLIGAVTSGVTYWVVGQQKASALRRERALQTTLSQGVDAQSGQIRRADPVPAPSPAAASCGEKRAALDEHGSPQEVLAALVSLGDECPSELVLPPTTIAKNFISDAIGAARTDCIVTARAEKWSEAIDRCGAYARYACQNKPEEWLERDDAFATFLVLRANDKEQTGMSPWTCAFSRTVQILETLSAAMPEKVWLTSFEMKDGAARMTGAGTSPDDVSEFMRGLNNLVWTPKGSGQIVERQRNGNLRVEVAGTGEVLEFTPSEVRFPFAHLELLEAQVGTDGGWRFTLETSHEIHWVERETDVPSSSCRERVALLDFVKRERRADVEARLIGTCPDALLDHYRAIVREDPTDAEAWLSLGEVARELGRRKDASVAFRRYLELRPEADNRREVEESIYFLEGQ